VTREQLDKLIHNIRPFSHPTTRVLGEFRKQVARLKREGLIDARVNARRAMPYTRAGGKSLREWLRSPDARLILEDKAVTIATSRVSDTQGYKTTKTGRLIIPLNEDASVSVENKNIVIRHSGKNFSVKRVKLPRKNLKAYLTEAEQLPYLEPGKGYYVFYGFDGRSKNVFRTTQLLREELEKYKRISDTPDHERDFFRTFEIVTIEERDRGAWEERTYRAGKSKSESAKERRKRYANLPAWKKELARQKKREYMREYRKKK
jgi:hypothetical protein